MKILTLAWGEAYAKRAECLRKNLAEFGYELEIHQVDGAPERPTDAYLLKPLLILRALERVPVLFLDADCVVRRRLESLEDLAAYSDAAAYSPRPGYFVDGVVYARPTERARAWLTAWYQEMKARGDIFADKVMSDVAGETRARILSLPPAYCWVQGWGMRDRYGNVDPAIEPNGRKDGCCSH